eukprot:NODE_10_length_61504_cov_0.956502.p50 type:complete len:131 gc:universal NODE_10_length_61504_cov_0.956502:10915-11307(+)
MLLNLYVLAMFTTNSQMGSNSFNMPSQSPGMGFGSPSMQNPSMSNGMQGFANSAQNAAINQQIQAQQAGMPSTINAVPQVPPGVNVQGQIPQNPPNINSPGSSSQTPNFKSSASKSSTVLYICLLWINLQ